MEEKLLDEQIARVMEAINRHEYGDDDMNQLQKQLHSLLDMKAKIPKKHRVRDWFWENSKPLVGAGATLVCTWFILAKEEVGPVLSKAMAIIPKPKV